MELKKLRDKMLSDAEIKTNKTEGETVTQVESEGESVTQLK
jgi:hypothetical protein